MKEYNLVLKTCDCLDESHVLNTYPLDVIPDKPLCPNDKRRWDVGWNGGTHPDGEVVSDIPFENFPIKWVDDKTLGEYGGYEDSKGNRYAHISSWVYAVREAQKFMSDDYPNKCVGCGKKWRGWDGPYAIVDDKKYCHDCAGELGILETSVNGKEYVKFDVIRDGLNVDSMYVQDNPRKYYTSMETCLTSHGLSENDCYTVHVQDNRAQGADALSGSISGDHWEIWKVNTDPNLSERSHWNFVGFVFEPSPEDSEILNKIERRK